LPESVTIAYLAAFIGAMMASAALVPLCRHAAIRFGYVANPRIDRWHEQPTPFLGGVAVAVPVIVGMGLTGGFRHHAVLVICAALIASVGLVDDVLSLKPATKLIAQIVLASVLLFFGHRLYWVESMTLDSLFTIIWVVGITNAFNLLDNMDGLCAGIAIIAGAAFLAGLPSATPGSTLFFQGEYLALLLGAAAGFLLYNIHPASIFMGDTGSLFLGFSLAVMGLGSEPGHATRSSLLSVISAPILVLVIPILDTTLVTLSRWLSGRAASVGGRDHSSHRLVAMGLSQQRAVVVLWSLAAITALTGYFARSLETSWSVLLILAVMLPLTVFTVYLGNVRVYDDADLSVLRRKGVTPLVVTFMYKRRVAEVFLDLALISVAYYAAYRLRFEGPEFEAHFREFMSSLPIVIAVQFIALFVIGVYRGVWHLFGLIDTVVFAKAVFFGTGAAALGVLLLHSTYSRTVFAIYGALLFLLLSVSRASFRLIGEFVARRRQTGERLVIYGAGAAAVVAMREVGAAYRVLGFIDDDPNKHRSRVHGYPVLGGFPKLDLMVRGGELDAILVSCRRLAGPREEELKVLTAVHGCRLKRLHVSIEEVGGSGPTVRVARIASGS
jgi:UDP-GlcNAc:undecaprenyl-phosphate/decaprenyl-phosphate GlcNAc-1-phosphate transferase